jgi:hypothetical protein
MIYCPKCGTANRDGSRFCNECGERLGTQTRLRCPDCGTYNPLQSVFCSECGGSLLSTPAPPPGVEAPPTIKGLSLPTKAAMNDGEGDVDRSDLENAGDDIPSWLRELGSTLPDEGSGREPAPEEDATEVPDWLRDLRASLPDEPRAVGPESDESDEETPDWLAGLRPAAPGAETEPESAPPASEPEEEERPDWLAELRSAPEREAELEPAPPMPTPEEEEEPDWLAQFRAPELETDAGSEPTPPTPGSDEQEMPDWLAEFRSPAPEVKGEPEPTPPDLAHEEEEVPDWLAEPQPAAPEDESKPEAAPPAPEPEPEEGEVPGWLAELRPAAPQAEAEPEATPPAPEPELEEGEVPGWLAELRPAAPQAEAEPEAAPPAPEPELEEGEVPGWLAELRPAAPRAEAEPEAVSPPPEPELEEEEVSDWLAELQPRPQEVESEPEPKPSAPEVELEDGEVPDWLAELRPAAPQAEAEPEAVPPAPALELEEEQVPDWLAELEPSVPEAEPEPGLPTPEPELEKGDMPDWLLELEPVDADSEPELAAPLPEADLGPSAAEEEPVSPPDEELPVARSTMPIWLAELQQDFPPDTATPVEEALAEAELPDWLVPAEEGAAEVDETLERAEIPDWLLALKPRELRAEEGEQIEGVQLLLDEVVEDTGLLAGLKGTLPVEMLIAQPRAAMAEEMVAPVADTPEARLFAEIVSQPPEVAPKPLAVPSQQVWTSLPRWITYLALIAAVTVPLLLGKPLLPRVVSPSPAVESLHAEIESLDSDARVLVAFDYDPTTSGEMDVLASTVIGHLMDQEARMIVVSLLPSGPATAQILLDEMVKARPSYVDSYGTSYAILGYLPGQAAAVRRLGAAPKTAFARDFQGSPVSDLEVMTGVTAIQDFDLILVLAAGQDTLRWWIEQAGTPYDIPLAAGVSASIEPLARPYYEAESRQLTGLAGGVPGAAAYEALGNNQGELEDATAARLDSLLAGHLILILVLVVGNGVYLVRRGSGREQ